MTIFHCKSAAVKVYKYVLFICLTLGILGASAFPIAVKASATEITTTPVESTPTSTPSNQSISEEMPTNSTTPTSTSMNTPEAPTTPPVESIPTSMPSNQPISNVALSGNYISDEVLVKFQKSSSREGFGQCMAAIKASIASEIKEIGILVLKVPKGNVPEAITNLQACPGIQYVEPNFIVRIADTTPSDPDWGNQYGLINIHAPQGWDLSTGSAAVTIAIVDTGVDLSHADLSTKIVPGYDFVNNDAIPQDDHGHGTHVAGIAAAITNNTTGIAGVSWGAQIMPVKVLNNLGDGTYADTAAGIIWAADQGAQVINLSLGGSVPSTTLEDAINYAYGKGVTLVAATGNTGSNLVLYPAHYPNVIAVGATDNANNRASFSNYGIEVDLVAPGVSIYSTWIGGYTYNSGTSMSAPFVSGLASILCGVPGNCSPYKIAQEMENTALDLGAPDVDPLYGYGLIQMDAAISLALYPTVLSITRADTDPTNAASVDFTVTFSEAVTGVDTSAPFDDFTLTTTGVTGASISAVSGSGDTYTVTVDTGSGNGAIRLDIVDDDSIQDSSDNPLGGTGSGNGNFTSGEEYTVLKITTFSDVPVDHWAYNYIEAIYQSGLTGGCSTNPLMYCPDATVTRAQMAVFLEKGIHGSSFYPPDVPPSFGDTTGHWAEDWIEALYSDGITVGCGNGNYCPDHGTTRAQKAIFLLKSKYGAGYTPPDVAPTFGDTAGHWAEDWIEQLASEGITAGCGGGNYCPDNPVTRAQMAVFLTKTFNLPMQ